MKKKTGGHRREQVASAIRHALQGIVPDRLADPRVRGLVTVTSIEISKDMREAKVGISVLPERFESQTIHALRDATIHIQKLVNKKLTMRRPPHLAFELDRSLKKQAEVLAAIHQAVEPDDERPGGQHADCDEGDSDVETDVSDETMTHD